MLELDSNEDFCGSGLTSERQRSFESRGFDSSDIVDDGTGAGMRMCVLMMKLLTFGLRKGARLRKGGHEGVRSKHVRRKGRDGEREKHKNIFYILSAEGLWHLRATYI